ncbi:MAG: OsmC family protein [Lewinellaceae bacterium]|nr:OsmC family protein [Lewinellaceae bacterium]
MTSTVVYQGELRTEATHLQSGTIIVTDAPTDNQGRGEVFSPTDLCATSLASCMLTIMGISARNRNLDISGSTATIKKIMAADPRRISRIEITLQMPPQDFSENDRKVLETAGRTCPVALSLHPNIEQVITFQWEQAGF